METSNLDSPSLSAYLALGLSICCHLMWEEAFLMMNGQGADL